MNKTEKVKINLQQGFTLIELLIVVVSVGILASVIVPNWLRFLTGHRVTAGKDILRQGIQQAQLKSQQEGISWQFSVRENVNIVEMAVHPTATSPSLATWEALNNFVQLDGETNLATSSGVSYVRFDEKGNVQYRLGRVTLSGKQYSDIKRCVIVSTLIGNTRSAREQSVPEDGKYCH
ncbi:MAG: type II secretion system protein [Cyanobacteria bacterium P01_F01_bin.86]